MSAIARAGSADDPVSGKLQSVQRMLPEVKDGKRKLCRDIDEWGSSGRKEG